MIQAEAAVAMYVLPRYYAVMSQLCALSVYIHAPVRPQFVNHRSLAGWLNVITGSSEPLTDTCRGAGMTQVTKNLINTKSNI